MREESLAILRRYWGYSSFRAKQGEIIDSILEGRDTVALLPTGAGKSICFQVPALVKPGICLVISPLIALMKDQVEGLRKRGIKAMMIHSGMGRREVDIALDNLIFGNYKLLYISPERLRSELFRARVAKMDISMVAVDEAHSISEWGHDFRPDYLTISQLFTIIERVPLIALTATATPDTLEDIVAQLELNNPAIFKDSFEREGLAYKVTESSNKYGSLIRLVSTVAGSGIVYLRSRKRCEEIASLLTSKGFKATYYHAGLPSQVRSERQESWLSGETSIICATNAFGMGIDKPDVRFVCHFDLPDTLEAYYQEAGRGGRDNEGAEALLIWNESDLKRLRQLLVSRFPKQEYLSRLYQRLYRYYEIAYGEGEGRRVHFNLNKIAQHYKEYAPTLYWGVKYLEGEKLLELTEEVEIDSTITFLVSRDQLYNVQLRSVRLDTFINALLRLYEGLFSGYTSIKEEYIARATRNSREGVVALLERLTAMGVISYRKGATTRLLIFNQVREREEHFFISKKRYEESKSQFISKVRSVVEYASYGEKCRSGRLMEYLGQEEWEECGICDICRAKRREEDGSNHTEMVRRAVIETLLSWPYTLKGNPTIEELAIALAPYEGEWQELLREMVDRKEVLLTDNRVVLNRK